MFQDSLLAPRPAWHRSALEALGRHGFLELHALVGFLKLDLRELLQELPGLLADRVLEVVREPTDGPRSVVLGLGPESADLLRGQGPRRRIPRPPAHMLDHDLLRNELGLVLESLDRMGHLELLNWQVARTRLSVSAQVLDRGHLARIPLVADALAVIRRGDVTELLLVEVDMGSVPLARMERKYQGYVAWWRADGPRQRFGTAALRVLTVASTPGRARRLIEAAETGAAGRGLGLLWFASREVVDVDAPEHLLGPHWCQASAPDEVRAL